MYVRLTGLTLQSQNGATGGPSRILKLHNPSRLTVQEVQVDIVNSDEKVAEDLEPHTYVALHVR